MEGLGGREKKKKNQQQMTKLRIKHTKYFSVAKISAGVTITLGNYPQDARSH